MAHSRTHLCKLLDGIADLLVEDAPVCNDDNRIKDLVLILAQTNELMCQPSDRIRFSAPCRMLNKIAPPNALFASSLKQLPYDIKLMVAGKDLLALLLTRSWDL